MTELGLTRAFDVILYPNMAYMVITCAMFSFGLSGIYVALRAPAIQNRVRKFLSFFAVAFAVTTINILPILNLLPFNYEKLLQQPLIQVLSFVGMYLTLAIPFFLAGLIFTIVFSEYASDIQTLYFWDLMGAAVGCIILVPFIPAIGPGGLLFVASSLGLFASGLFSTHKMWSLLSTIAGLVLLLLPFAHSPDYFDFREHLAKRGVKEAKESGKVELTRWDPVSKIDIIDLKTLDPITKAVERFTEKKHIAYDGGSQSSHFYPFDGDYQRLRKDINDRKDVIMDHFWQRGVLASHYLKRDTNQRVLIIGSAGGQETKAAIMYGAAHVDAVEMVRTVVDLAKTKYAEYNGNIFNHPNVDSYFGEGRSFLRASRNKYDIIQIFSNHTSSSIAAGSGAMAPNYLLTSEAYRDYFQHLTENGILHINHHLYPRLVTTAALAWKYMGRSDFQKHVAVFERSQGDRLPTFLVKMKPWTEAELEEVKVFFSYVGEHEQTFSLVENPLAPQESALSLVFYSGSFPDELAKVMDFRISPISDDRPYFNFFRKKIGELEPDPKHFLSISTAKILNSQLVKGLIPMDLIHLFVTGALSLFFSGVFIFLPLYFSSAGKSHWNQKYHTMIYFSCLGSGFIIIELVFIQIFMKLIGFPVYTYSLVIFTLLFAAGLGSLYSRKLKITAKNRWTWPFVGILVTGSLFCVSHPYIFNHLLAFSMILRMSVAALLILPLGFFLGMPFPLGILALERQPRGAIPWAWGLNGLFTVVGGFMSVVLAIFIGFRNTVLVALLLYVLSFWAFSRIRQAAPIA